MTAAQDAAVVVPYELDGGAAPRARLGLIALSSDYTAEQEFNAVLARLPGVGLYTTRLANAQTVTPETLRAMGPLIAAAAGTILRPGDLDAMAYGCTSASTLLGPEFVRKAVGSVHPGTPVTTPITAAFRAMRALGVQRVAVLTPYQQIINQAIADAFSADGFTVAASATFDEHDDPTVARIAPASVIAAGRSLVRRGGAEALFVSCTSIRMLTSLDTAEADLGLPVVSSNQAMIWDSLRLAGIADAVTGFGTLLRAQPVEAS